MSDSTPQMYPLLFEPALVERVWGGRQLETRLGKTIPSSQPIGESWEIYWKNRIANGEFRGKTLGEVIKEYPEAMVGSKDADPEFPQPLKATILAISIANTPRTPAFRMPISLS